MSIEIASQASPELVEAINALIPQLSTSTPALSASEVEQLLNQPSTYLFVFRSEQGDDAGAILGMLTLATFRIPTGVRAWIEDVVVDGKARGQGAGQKLVEAAVDHARSIGAKTVDLTSRPSREAANRLYQRAGFQARQTNVYRYSV
ncbi:MAG: GNAT family N-acetyltransferase [Actinomycetaceae bacterium]|nr:GNAT family N-acetyltransferase [Actinomycetaceae bacterium]